MQIVGFLVHRLTYLSDEALFYMQSSESVASLGEELGETDDNDSFQREVVFKTQSLFNAVNGLKREE